MFYILDCSEEEYTCANDKCVPLFMRCNGYDDCGDNSDEDRNCAGTHMG